MREFSSKINPKAQARMNFILEILSNKSLTKKELADVLGISSRSTQRYVTYLRKTKLIYVDYWKRLDHKAVQHFKTGDKKDAAKPRALNDSERSKKYRQSMDDETKDFYLARRRAKRWADKWSKVAPPETFWIRA